MKNTEGLKDINKSDIDKMHYNKAKLLIEEHLRNSEKKGGEYFFLNKQIDKDKDKMQDGLLKKVRVAVISTFAIKALDPFMKVEGFINGFDIDLYYVPYGQYELDTVEMESDLYKFKPDVVIIFFRITDLCQGIFNFRNDLKDEEMNGESVKVISTVNRIVNNINVNGNNPCIIIHNFDYPKLSVREASLSEFGLKNIQFVNEMNNEIKKICDENINCMYFNQNYFTNIHGYLELNDEVAYSISQNPFVVDKYALYAKEYMRYFKSYYSQSYKCIAVDADNTLWGGVVGEDGIDGIKLSDQYPGSSFRNFQKKLLEYYNKGVLLVMLSKNNLDDVLEVFEKHPEMVLKKEHFIIIKANWENKCDNLVECISELNIGLDSVVFIDDNPNERSQMRIMLPDVLTPELPKSPDEYCKFIDDLIICEKNIFSSEDIKRNDMYKAEIKRKDIQKKATSIEDFYYALGIECEIGKVTSLNIRRVETLVNRTNQFNLTTNRYSYKELMEFLESDRYELLYLSYKDKYADNGVVGFIFVDKGKKEDTWYIDTFLLSCRVIGKTVENALMNYIIQSAKNTKVKYISGLYKRSNKNSIVENFYKEFNFKSIQEAENSREWLGEVETLTIKECPWINVQVI